MASNGRPVSDSHFFLLRFQIKTDRLMTLLPLPPNALEELPHSPQSVLMELLGSLQHPYIYPILDLGFFHNDSHHYACLVMPFNPRGSLKDLIYKVSKHSTTRLSERAINFIFRPCTISHSRNGTSHGAESTRESHRACQSLKYKD